MKAEVTTNNSKAENVDKKKIDLSIESGESLTVNL